MQKNCASFLFLPVKNEDNSSGVVNLINKILLEPQADEFVTRFREDGILYEYMKLPLSVSRMHNEFLKSKIHHNIEQMRKFLILRGNCVGKWVS